MKQTSVCRRTACLKSKATPHNSAARPAMSFPPSAACKFLDLPPVNLRNLHLHLTKNPFAGRPPHLCGVALKKYAHAREFACALAWSGSFQKKLPLFAGLSQRPFRRTNRRWRIWFPRRRCCSENAVNRFYGAAASISGVEDLISPRAALFRKCRKPTLWRSSSVHFGGRIADGGFDFRASSARRWNRGSGNTVGRAAQKPAQNEGHFGKRAL